MMKTITVFFAITLLPLGSASLSEEGVVLPGDAMIGGLFSIQGSADGRCSGFMQTSIQIYEAVRWAIETLNERNFIPGVTLGLKAYKTCTQPSRAAQSIIDLLQSDDISNSSGDVFAVLGPGYSSETQTVSALLSSLPVHERLLQVSYSATASILANRDVYRNLYRIIESDNVQVKVILALLKQLGWNYIAVAYEDDVYGRDGANALRVAAQKEHICIPIFMKITATHIHKSIVLLRQELDTNTSPVTGLVFIGHGPTVERILEYLDKHLTTTNFQIIVSESLSLESSYLKDGNGVVLNHAKGALIQIPPYKPIEEFSIAWNKLFQNDTAFRIEADGNVWLREFFESETGCRLNLVTDIQKCLARRSAESFTISQQPMYVYYAVLGVAVLAQVYKNVRSSVCVGETGVCEAMRTVGKDAFVTEIETMRFKPSDVLEDLLRDSSTIWFREGALTGTSDALYQVYNYKDDDDNQFSFHKVGSYNGSTLAITDAIRSYDRSGKESTSVDGRCHVGSRCSGCLPRPEDQIIHVPGDFYVVALVPVHNRYPASGRDPLSHFRYGPLREAISVDLVEAVLHAVDTVNNKSGRFKSLLKDKRVGLVVLDTSNNPIIIREKILKLHKGELLLGDGSNSSSIYTKVIGYVGPLASSISIPLSSLMENLDHQVFVAYASTSSVLNDRRKYPTFMRTSSSVEEQVGPMMVVVASLGATYIQIVYTNEPYGQSGRDAVVRGAKAAGVCVAQMVPVNETTFDKDFIGVVNELRRFPRARLVVVFTRSHTTPKLMKILSHEISLGEFIFFGSREGWANRMDIIRGNYNLKGSLTMAQAIPADTEFEQYLQKLPNQSSRNPWLSQYLEKSANCYFPESFEKTSAEACTEERLSLSRQIDSWVPFAINAVYAIVMGFDSALEVVCDGAVVKCEEYSYINLIEHTLNVKLDIYRDGNVRRVFDDSGNGASGFKIYSVVPIPGSDVMTYAEVGLAIGTSLTFHRSGLDPNVNYNSSCQTEYECSRCRPDLHEPSTFPYVTVLVLEAVTIAILAAVIVVTCISCRRRRGQHEKHQLHVLNAGFNDSGGPYANVDSHVGDSTDVYLHPVVDNGCDTLE